MESLIFCLSYILLTPLICLLIDAIISFIQAKIKRQNTSSFFSPFHSLKTLLYSKNSKDNHSSQFKFLVFHLFFILLAGSFFLYEVNILLVLLCFILSCLTLYLAVSGHPETAIYAQREFVLNLSLIPMLILLFFSFYFATNAFHFYAILNSEKLLLAYIPATLLCLLFILSTRLFSFPAHTYTSSAFNGPSLAIYKIASYYKKVFFFTLIYMFFSFNPILAICLILFIYSGLYITRGKSIAIHYRSIFRLSWLITFLLLCSNMAILCLVMR